MRRLFDRPLMHIVYAALAVILLVSAPLGGLQTAASKEPSEFTAGTLRSVPPYEIAISKVVMTQSVGDDLPELEGTAAYLLVAGKVRNPLAETPWVSSLDPLVTLEGVPGLMRGLYSDKAATDEWQAVPAIHVVQDGQLLGAPGPGLTYDVAFIFKVTDRAAVGPDITVVTRALTYRENFVEGGYWWADGTTNGQLTLPVVRAADPSPSASDS